MEKGSVVFQNDGGAKKEKVLSRLSGGKEGSGCPQAWAWSEASSIHGAAGHG